MATSSMRRALRRSLAAKAAPYDHESEVNRLTARVKAEIAAMWARAPDGLNITALLLVASSSLVVEALGSCGDAAERANCLAVHLKMLELGGAEEWPDEGLRNVLSPAPEIATVA